jgi:hypothetical protein
VIDGGELLFVLCRCLLHLQLRCHGRNALLAGCGNFNRQGLASDAPRAVEAGAAIGDVDGCVVDNDCIRHGTVVDLNVRDIGHVVDGAVVVETISVPVAPLVAGADLAESVVNAAIVANVPAPISVAVAVSATGESPVARRPQHPRLGRACPRTGHPVIAFRRIAPIPRRPEVAVARSFRLRVFGQLRRGLGGFDVGLAVAGVVVVVIIV